MQKELNAKYIASLTPPETGRIEVSDTKRKGLRFRLYADGRGVWVYEKRIKGGPKRKHTLGTQSKEYGLSQARDDALTLEVEASKGIDRVAEAEAAKLAEESAKAQQQTVRDVLAIYDDLHLRSLRSGAERLSQLNAALGDHLDLQIDDLRKKHLQAAIDEKASTGRVVAANRVRSALRAFTHWAAQRGYLSDDIGERLPAGTKEQARDVVLSNYEVQAIWHACADMGPIWGPAFKLLILTAQRRQEILGLDWSEVNFDARTITKAGTMTKNRKAHVTHLSEPALEILQELASKVEGDPAGLVFTTTGTTPVSGVSRAKARLDKVLEENVQAWRLHDLRTAFATAMAKAGIPETIADRVLNHSAVGSAPSGVSRIYNRFDMLEQRASALDAWAAIVTSAAEEKVVQLHG